MLALILLGSPIVLAATVLLFVLSRLRLLPAGVPNPVYWVMLNCFAVGAVFLAFEVDLVVLDPARFQTAHLGRSYGTVLSLRSFTQDGFQDPNSRWVYALSAVDAATLRKRCVWRYAGARTPPECELYSYMTDRIADSIRLDGNELIIDEGLW